VVEPKPTKKKVVVEEPVLPVKRQPTEAQKIALEKAREKRRIAKKTKSDLQITTQPTSIIFV